MHGPTLRGLHIVHSAPARANRRSTSPLGLVRVRPLELLTTPLDVVTISNMKAVLVARSRIVYAENAFAELVLWKVPSPLAGSKHAFKYRLAYVVNGICVVRYDNEVGKGDHRHFGAQESDYSFTTPDELLAAFERDIARWNRENSDP